MGKVSRGLVVAIVAALLLIAALGLAKLSRDAAVLSPEAVPASGAPVTQVPVELIALPDAGAAPLLQALDAARESIRLKIYLLTDELIVETLARAAARGVDVRVLIEAEPFGGGETNRLAADALRAAGVSVQETPRTFQYSHEKSLVVDDRRAFIMTHNLTYSSFNRNREYAVVVDDSALVAEVAAVFDADWQRVEPSLGEARLVWSPVNSRRSLTGLIDSARVSLELEHTSVLDGEVIDRLVAAVERGVRVRLITPAVHDPSEWEFEPLTRLHQAGAAVRFLDEPYVHAKVVLVDGQVAMIGSQNLSATSLDQNRELGIIFDDAGAVNRLASFFLADWNLGAPWTGPQPTATLPPSGIVRWRDAAGYVGQTITVEGVIVDTHNTGKVAFLNFDDDRSFTLVIFADEFERFPEPPEDLFWQKRVRVTGQVQLYNDKPEMVIEAPGQIEVLEDMLARAGVPTATLPASGIVPWQDAGNYLGREVKVEGDVVRSYNSGKVVFLNFADDYQDTLSVVIFAADFEKWPQPPEQLYLGQRVQVTGKVKDYQGAPEIIVEEPDQIEIVGPAETPSVATPTPPAAIPWEEAAGYIGEEVVVQGTVVDTYKSDKVIFLNFGANRDDFKVVIFERNWDQWPQLPDELYAGRTVRVRGEVQAYQGTAEIIVDRPGQVELVE